MTDIEKEFFKKAQGWKPEPAKPVAPKPVVMPKAVPMPAAKTAEMNSAAEFNKNANAFFMRILAVGAIIAIVIVALFSMGQ
jgi:hypothetical protein